MGFIKCKDTKIIEIYLIVFYFLKINSFLFNFIENSAFINGFGDN